LLGYRIFLPYLDPLFDGRILYLNGKWEFLNKETNVQRAVMAEEMTMQFIEQ
jgi:hypothetical protein